MKSSAVGFHMGSTILHLSGKYPTLLEVLLEIIQNCIDKNARDIWVTINQKARNIMVRDDGDGVTKEEFDKALDQIGMTLKKESALGRFGLGLISPVGKCEKFTFVSTPRGDPHSYIEWTFRTEDIKEQKEVHIPLRTRPDLWFGDYHGRGTTGVNWRTEVKLEKYIKDRFLSKVTMESLCEGIITKYNEAMKRRKVVVHVTVTTETGERQHQDVYPKDFEGQKLPEMVLADKNAGDTHFRLFLARKTAKGPAGKVRVGEVNNDFRISFAQFSRSLPEGCKLSDEAVHAFTSGIFEGDILTSRAKFHSNRRGFEVNDALIGFAAAIDSWFIKHGLDPFMDAQETKQAERYQSLGLRSLKVLEAIVNSPVGEHLMKVINSFRRGTIGPGHVEKPGNETPYTALSAEGTHSGSAGSGESPRAKNEPKTEHEGHHPYTVIGPRGQRRIIVRSGSLGIQLVHETLEGNRLYELNTETGLLHMNVRHPLWLQCEENGEKTIMRFQEYLMLQALAIEAVPEEWREYARLAVEEVLTAPYVFMLINADSLSGRTVSRLKSVTTQPEKKTKSVAISKK